MKEVIMANVIINKETCVGCGLCVKDCSRKAIVLLNNKAQVNLDLCNECGHCLAICPENSFSMPQYDKNEIVEVEEERLNLDPNEFLCFQPECILFPFLLYLLGFHVLHPAFLS